jgi:hypothetical protein
MEILDSLHPGQGLLDSHFQRFGYQMPALEYHLPQNAQKIIDRRE